MPQSTKPTSTGQTARAERSASTSTSAYSSGPAKCMAEVNESRNGRSLNRSRGAE
ncbi:Uncharacterised protein [Mycobacteroides abscessus]|nr:Uncharacterised protein [Mycobacteroides abscessus]